MEERGPWQGRREKKRSRGEGKTERAGRIIGGRGMMRRNREKWEREIERGGGRERDREMGGVGRERGREGEGG